MTRTETIGVLSLLKAAYPNAYSRLSRSDAEAVVDLWLDLFRNDTAGQVGMAVKSFLSEDASGFPPTPGQIRARMPKRGARPDRSWAQGLEQNTRWQQLKERRRAAGLPADYWEARAAGMTAGAYLRTVDGAGLALETALLPPGLQSGTNRAIIDQK